MKPPKHAAFEEYCASRKFVPPIGYGSPRCRMSVKCSYCALSWLSRTLKRQAKRDKAAPKFMAARINQALHGRNRSERGRTKKEK